MTFQNTSVNDETLNIPRERKKLGYASEPETKTASEISRILSGQVNMQVISYRTVIRIFFSKEFS